MEYVPDMRNNFQRLARRKAFVENRDVTVPVIKREIEAMYGESIGINTLYSWWNNDITRFDTRMVTLLCAYFDCGPGDLLELVPANDAVNCA